MTSFATYPFGHELAKTLLDGYPDGAEPDLAKCSLVQAEAFCVARLDPEAWGLTRPAAPHAPGEPAGGRETETGAERPGENPAAAV